MSYAMKAAAVAKRKVNLIYLKMNHCSLTHGVAPCTATETGDDKCYNTFPTCNDTANYSATTQTYKFTDAQQALPFGGVRPYITSVSSLPTELKEDNTVVSRLKVKFIEDEELIDLNDPYRADRTSIQGNYWQKWLARNPNYKNGVMELYEGFIGEIEGNYELRWAGQIDNVEIDKDGSVTIEGKDFLGTLKDKKYPTVLDSTLTSALGMFWDNISSTAEMELLDALEDDYCRRIDFEAFTVTPTTSNTGGSLTSDTYRYYVYAIDSESRVFAASGEVTQTILNPPDDTIVLSWSAVTGAGEYRVYRATATGYNFYRITSGTSFQDTDQTPDDTFDTVPYQADRYFKKTGSDPDDWTWQSASGGVTFTVDNNTGVTGSYYIMLDDEIIYVNSTTTTISVNFNVTAVGGNTRGLYGTDIARHEIGTNVRLVYLESATDPFLMMKTLLTDAGISASYIDSQFDTYAASWSGINVLTDDIVKETTVARLYFDLVKLMDCVSWAGEDGKIKIKKRSDTPGTYATITDNDIMQDSFSLDRNDESRFTRWFTFWNRFDVEASLDEPEAYSSVKVTVDSDAESANSYNDEINYVEYTTWLNDGSGSSAAIASFLTSHHSALQTRTNKAQRIVTLETELNKYAIQVGDLIKLSTRHIQDEAGNDVSEKVFRIIYKEVNGIIIKLKMIEVHS